MKLYRSKVPVIAHECIDVLARAAQRRYARSVANLRH